MSEPFVLGLDTHNESGARQIHPLPFFYRLIPLPEIPPNHDLYLYRGLSADMADLDAHQCCWWWY